MATRQEVIDALKAQLETITLVNGYSTNIGQDVKEWSQVLVEPKSDALIFGDAEESFTEENARLKCKLNVEIQATVFTDDYGTVARKVLRDIIAALYKRKSLGLQRVSLTVTENSFDADDGGRDLVFVYLKTEITYYDDIL